MEHERRRTGWLVLTVVAMLVFLFFGVGTTYSLLAPAYVFEDGELPGEAAILSGSLALAAFGTSRLRAADRRLRAHVPDYGAWLPARDATNGEGRIDLDAETARLRRLARRAAGLVLVWTAVFAGGVAGTNAADQTAADLLASGVRVAGVVVSVDNPAKGTPSFRVRYESPGTAWTAEIVRDTTHAYRVGDVVTVIYDPADPEHVRTPEEPNENQVLVGFGVLLLLAGFIGMPFALNGAAGWRGRARAVTRTGWRVAAVTVVPDPYRGRGRRLPEVRVRYRDGSGIVLRCALSTHGPGVLAGQEHRRAWIGGWGRRMVVLFPYGPRKPGPYAMPVRAIGSRDQSMSPVR